MFKKQKNKKQRCFWCGKEFLDVVQVNGKISCHICIRATEKKR